MDSVTTRLGPNLNFIEIDVNGTKVTISLNESSVLRDALYRAECDAAAKKNESSVLRNALYRAECDAAAKKNELSEAFRAVQMAHIRGEKINCTKAVRTLGRLRTGESMSLILAKDIVEAMWMRPE